MSIQRGQSILEKWLEDMPNSNNNSVKKERKNLDDIFASTSSSAFLSNSLFRNNNTNITHQRMPPISTPTFLAGQQHSLLSAPSSSAASAPSKPPVATPKVPADTKTFDNNAIDLSSVKGIFGWSSVNDIPVPYILRGEQKLVPVRVVELKIIGKFSNSLPWKVFSCINIRSYFVTENEIKLLNEINSFHCENLYGFEPFTASDVVVCLTDVVTLYTFLETSKGIFTYGLAKTTSANWLGFVNISGLSTIPYICKESAGCAGVRKYVPQSLIQHSVLLVKVDKVEMTEWDLSYLRMLCLYAGLEYYNINSGDTLCYLDDLKWDASLSPLYIEEYSPPVNNNNRNNSNSTGNNTNNSHINDNLRNNGHGSCALNEYYAPFQKSGASKGVRR